MEMQYIIMGEVVGVRIWGQGLEVPPLGEVTLNDRGCMLELFSLDEESSRGTE